jgi:alpha-1,6-mannosyltransferase
MKIVDVCAFYTPQGGGVRTYVEQKLAIGPRLGHEIVILAPGENHAVHEYGEGARIVTIPSPRFPLDRKYRYFDDEAALHRALDELAPDFVEVSSPWRSPSMVQRWQGSARRSLFMHADPLSAYAYRWFQPLFARTTIDRQFARFWDHLRTLGEDFDLTVCANQDLSRRLAEGGVANVVTHALGVETGVFSPERRDPQLRTDLLAQCALSPDAHLLVGAGRLGPEKRWPMVIEAVAAAGHHAPLGMVLLGEGRERRAIRKAIAGNPHIRLFEPVRHRETFAAILASADALIHGCEAETFCMVAAEARASGTPVIVPDLGGAADHALGGAGETYRAGDAASAAQAILRRLATPPSERRASLSRTNEQHFAELFRHYATISQRVTGRVGTC